jgi:hypothetical protein
VEELEPVWVCYGWRTPTTAHSNQFTLMILRLLCIWLFFIHCWRELYFGYFNDILKCTRRWCIRWLRKDSGGVCRGLFQDKVLGCCHPLSEVCYIKDGACRSVLTRPLGYILSLSRNVILYFILTLVGTVII